VEQVEEGPAAEQGGGPAGEQGEEGATAAPPAACFRGRRFARLKLPASGDGDEVGSAGERRGMGASGRGGGKGGK
jgi:hypothetical protein